MPTATTMRAFKPPSIKQLKNEKALKIYAAFLCGVIFLVVLGRRLHAGPQRNTCSGVSFSRWPRSLLPRAVSRGFHKLERRVTSRWLGRPSLGLVVLVAVFIAGNVALSTTTLALYRVNHLASRFGWLAAANMVLCVFFGLKNTPMAPIASVSHAQLNILHRTVGYATVFLVLLHAIFYTVHFGRLGRWPTLTETSNLEGIGAGVSMLVLLMAIFRHRGYEIFYASHVIGFVFVVILTALHRPDWAKKLPLVMLFTFSLWTLDRTIRTMRILYNLINNQVTFHPLPDGCTRLFLRKPHVKNALPGSHCFLWIPRIHIYQTHPFTIVSSSPLGLELVMKTHGGFTKAVSEFATQHPGRAARVSVDGPYGSLPNQALYDKLILIAGGSGAAFTFGFLNRILNHCERSSWHSIDFVWSVRSTEHLSWFYEHLHNVTKLNMVVITLYITNEQPRLGSDLRVRGFGHSGAKQGGTIPLERLSSDHEACLESGELQGLLSGSASKAQECVANVEYKRMSADAVIHRSMQTLESHGRVLVAACGPRSLMDAVRDSAEKCGPETGCRIDVHCEDFGA